MKNKFYLLIILCNLFIISCREIECPSFPQNLTNFLPRKLHDEIQFTNQVDTITLEITKDSISKPQNFKSNCDCICSVEKSQQTTKNVDFNIQLESYIYCSGEQNENCSIVVILNEEALPTDFSTKNISDTVCLETDNIRFPSVKIIKNYGIVEFKDNLYNCTWKLVE